ncbi:hypothetical protein B0E55_06374 [Rhodococcus sp. 66b]|jgi:hypothetical protein|nr:hypothetical protein B0E55_06374 [Rhodococcus sp. 66b]
MLVESKPWPSLPALDLEIHAPRLVTGQEIRVVETVIRSTPLVGVSFGAEGDSLVIDALLCGAPRILFNVASMPLAVVSKESDGHPIVYGVDGMLPDGGIDEIPLLPGLPEGPMALYPGWAGVGCRLPRPGPGLPCGGRDRVHFAALPNRAGDVHGLRRRLDRSRSSS